jgi:hypothetical protein
MTRLQRTGLLLMLSAGMLFSHDISDNPFAQLFWVFLFVVGGLLFLYEDEDKQ